MAVQRFVLDTSTLNDAAFGLDGPSAFILNQSTLDGSDALDGGQFLTVATGSASLGGLVASANGVVTKSAIASATLGGLVASATTKTTKSSIASANLQGLVASATTKTTKSAIASANLHGLVASATTKTGKFAIGSADLGGLVAVATGTVIPPTPPEPEPTPSGGRQYAAPRRKKIEPLPVVEIPVIRPKRRYAVCSASLGGMNARGESTITFSILDDDAEVLLLV